VGETVRAAKPQSAEQVSAQDRDGLRRRRLRQAILEAGGGRQDIKRQHSIAELAQRSTEQAGETPRITACTHELNSARRAQMDEARQRSDDERVRKWLSWLVGPTIAVAVVDDELDRRLRPNYFRVIAGAVVAIEAPEAPDGGSQRFWREELAVQHRHILSPALGRARDAATVDAGCRPRRASCITSCPGGSMSAGAARVVRVAPRLPRGRCFSP
jgi:hypothetical protein